MLNRNAKNVVAMALMISASNMAFAAPPSANLAVSLVPPAIERVNVANQYKFVVANIGNRDAAAVKLIVDLPTTNTSPQKFLMGQISGLDGRCSISIGKITCILNTVRRGISTDVKFFYSIPVSSASLAINGAASTTSADSNANNNLLQYVPNQVFYSTQVVGPANVSNSHCTGNATLSSYFECERFPSSIATHAAVFNADGTISFPDAPGYSGYWQQAPGAIDRLSFQYLENGNEILNFQGFGSQNNCFDGVSHFPDNLNYVSPYRVCI